ncbi:MAG: glycosyltransferase [Alistipes sp.]|nr:glycosyltransferase [Alistipes sp.]MDE6862602.1 glycosyltransferase [Alistipes sp.]MDE7128880.1 glycosyltransferase [Alistipes sp.]
MKRVLIVSPMPPLIGGVSISSGRLYDNLRRDGYDVDYYNLKFSNGRYNTKIGILLRFMYIPIYVLLHKRYDIIHCHVPGVSRKLYLSLVKPIFFKGAKTVMTIHGDISSLLRSKPFLFALRRMDSIICVQPGDSAKLPDDIRSRSEDIPAFIMPRIIPDSDVPSDIMDFVGRDDKPLIIHNGAVVLSDKHYDLYGFEDMADLYFKLKQAGVGFKMLLIVIGETDTADKRRFVEAIRTRIAGEPDILLVHNQGFELLPILKYGFMYIRPTKTDGDSLSVREALAMGLHTVASDRTVRPDGVVTYHNAEELFDKVKALLIDNKRSLCDSNHDFYDQIKSVYDSL